MTDPEYRQWLIEEIVETQAKDIWTVEKLRKLTTRKIEDIYDRLEVKEK